MLHEVYAPSTVADLAWSRQKAVALSTLIQQARSPPTTAAAAVPPRVTLLYGPPGCGKLESLKALLREDVPPTASAAAAAAKSSASTQRAASSTPASTPPAAPTGTHPTVYHIFHTCEATVHAYAQYLQSVLTMCRGQASGAELPLLPLRSGARQPGATPSSSPQDGVRRGPSAGAASPPPHTVHHAHIVKCYGEPASHALHHCTLLFLREYEDLRATAQREAQQLQLQYLWSSSSSAPARLMDHLRRNLVFFVHTTHDTHNDKLDLNTSFPVAFLQSPALEQFHCTAITEINLRKRLRTVVGLEAQRRAQQRFGEDARPLPPSPPPPAPRRGAQAKRGATRHALTPSTPLSPACEDVIDADALNAIAAGSQGDIRQALLQVQWTCLCPPPSRSCTTAASTSTSSAHTRADESAARIWARLEARRAALRQGGGMRAAAAAAPQLRTGTGTELGGVATAAGADTAESCVTRRCVHAESKDDADDSGSIDTVEAVVISSSSSSSATSSTATSPLQRRTDETQTAVNSDGNVLGWSRKRPRAAAVTDRPSSSPPPSSSQLVTDVLSFAESQVDAVADRKPLPPHASANIGPRRRAGRPRSPSPAASPTSSSSAPSQQPQPSQQQQQQQQRCVMPTTRDEYLGLSHAVGRLLTQKYTLDEVLDILNVPPRKIVDYLANNQIRYFADDQLASCAACTDAASDADALQTSEGSTSYASGAPSAAALRARRQLAERTTAGESVGHTGRLLDVVALHAFYAAYCALHREVRPPPGFVAQEPPPFLRSAYPRLRDTDTRSAMDGDGTSVPLSEQEWVLQALARLDSAAQGTGAARRGAQHHRRRGLGAAAAAAAAADDRNPDLATPRIQTEEVDIVREGLPDAVQRCGSTDAALLDYYALAPYIVLTVEPRAAPAYAALSTLSPSPSPTCATAPSGRVPASLVFTSGVQPSSAAGPSRVCGARTSPSPSPSSAEAGAASAAPRRTVFRFASAAPSVVAAPTPPPPPRRVCAPLQLAILQRGYSPATARLRDELFALGSDGCSSGGGGSAEVVVGAAIDPLTAHVDEIEEFDDD